MDAELLCTPGDEHRTSKMEPVLLTQLIKPPVPPPFYDEDDKTGRHSCLLRRRSDTLSPVQWYRNQFTG